METPNTTWIDFESLKAKANLVAAGIDISTIDTNTARPTSSPRTTIEHNLDRQEDPARVQALGNLLDTVFKEY